MCFEFLVLLVNNLLALAPNLLSMASNLSERTSNFDCFDCFAVLFLVTNLPAMASQPAFDGLKPKCDGLQLLRIVLLRPFFNLGWRVAPHSCQYAYQEVCVCATLCFKEF